jgi:hypothetical protein
MPVRELQSHVREVGGFSYDDMLLTCAFETFNRWNRRHNLSRQGELCIWRPVDVRVNPGTGFGNGSSRLCVHDRYPSEASLLHKCRYVGRQVASSERDRVWPDPGHWVSTRLPLALMAPLVRNAFARPWIDLGSALFSHMDLGDFAVETVFRDVRGIDCIGPLLPSQPVALHGTTQAGVTRLTLVYDPGLLSSADAHALAGLYEQQVAGIREQFRGLLGGPH